MIDALTVLQPIPFEWSKLEKEYHGKMVYYKYTIDPDKFPESFHETFGNRFEVIDDGGCHWLLFQREDEAIMFKLTYL